MNVCQVCGNAAHVQESEIVAGRVLVRYYCEQHSPKVGFPPAGAVAGEMDAAIKECIARQLNLAP
jgi:hypothetical protein